MAKSNNIKATITLDDSRFNNSVKNINSSLKAVNSAFGVSKSQIDSLGATTNNVAQLQDNYRTKIDLLIQKKNAYTQAIQKEQQELAKNTQENARLQQVYTQQQQKIAELTTTYGKNSAEVKKEEEALRKMATELQKNERDITTNNSKINSYTTTINKATVEMDTAQKELGELGNAFNQAGGQAQQTNNILGQFSMDNVISGVQNAVGKISNAFDKINTKIIGFGKEIFNTGMEYEKIMSEVRAVSDTSVSDMALLDEQAKDLGKNTVKSAMDVAKGYTFMGQAGWSAQEMLSAMPDMLNLSIASGEDMASTTNIVTDSLTAFGKEAKDAGRLADILAMASNKTNTNVAMMGESFKYVAPVAGALKYSMEDTSLALGVMANSGIKASQAGTALRAGLTNLAKPTAKMEAAMTEYGISLRGADGEMLTFRGVMDSLRSSLGDLEEDTQANVIATLFGKEAMSGWMAIVNAAPDKFNELRDAIDNSAGATQNMADIMGDNVYGKLKGLESKMEALKLKAFEALYPVIIKVMEGLDKFMDNLTNLSDEQLNNIITMAKYSLMLGVVFKGLNVLVGGVGSVLSIMGNLKIVMGGVGLASSTMATATATAGAGVASVGAGAVASSGLIAGLGGALLKVATFMTGPWGLAIAAGVAVGVYAIKKGREDSIKEVDLFADGIKKNTVETRDYYGNLTTTVVKEQVKISESTKNNLDNIIKMQDDHSNKLLEATVRRREITNAEIKEMEALQNKLNNGLISGDKTTAEQRLAVLQEKFNKEKEITTTEYTTLAEQMAQINEETNKKLDEKYNNDHQKLIDYMVKVQGLKEEEAKKELEFMDINHNNQKVQMEEYQAQYMELLQKKFNDENGLTVAENQQLMDLQSQLKNYQIQTLSESETEAQLIQNRMKEYSTRISAEQIGVLIKDAETVRAKRVEEAEAEFNEYERILTQQKATSESLSDEQYLSLIEKAKTAKNDRITLADEEKIGVLAKLEELNQEAFDGVDKNTGKILNAWEKFTKSNVDNAEKSVKAMQSVKDSMDSIPDNTTKTITIHTNYTSGGMTQTQGIPYNGISHSQMNGYSLNNIRSINKMDLEPINNSKTTSTLDSEISVLRSSVRDMTNTMSNVLNTIGDVPGAIESLKENLTVVTQNVIKLDKMAFTNTIDTGLQTNKKNIDIFNGKNRGR